MVGSVAGARRALSGALPQCGEGSYRTVYRDGDTVYKIENEEGREFFANNHEWDAYRQSRSLPANVRIPTMRLMQVDNTPIIAARYVEGQPMGDCMCHAGIEPDHDETCVPVDIEKALSNYDLAWGNVIFDGTIYWLVDVD